MGAYNYIPYRPRKRKDYDLSEIEKKYTEEELTKKKILFQLFVVFKIKIFKKLK